MKNNENKIIEDEMFNDIQFNRNEIKGTDETFYNDKNGKNYDECSLDLEKSENSLSSDKLDLCDKSIEEEMNKVTLNDNDDTNKKASNHKITKYELNTIPLPIFDCIYCANEKISFNHLINEEISFKYLYNAEKKDIYLVDILQKYNLLFLENENNIKELLSNEHMTLNSYKLKSIVELLLKNTEYISKYYNLKESQNFLKQKRKREKYYLNTINKKRKEIKKKNNFFFEQKEYGKDKNELFEDDSSGNNDDNNFEIEKVNKYMGNENEMNQNKLDKSTEDKICDSFNRILDDCYFMDLTRKIKWNDIDFEDKQYNVWEPNFTDDEKDQGENDS